MGEQGDRSPHLGRAGVKTLDEVALTANERQAIEAAAATLRARFPVTDIVLYGSKARGDSDPGSDIDLLVLTSRPLDHDEQSGMWSHLHEISTLFDVLLSSADRGSPFLARGRPLGVADPRRGRARGRVVCRPRRRAAPRPDASAFRSGSVVVALKRGSREASRGRMERMAEEAIASARADIDAGRRRSAINRAYYAAFYAVSAVLLGRGRHFVKHAGVLHRPTSRDLIHPGLPGPGARQSVRRPFRAPADRRLHGYRHRRRPGDPLAPARRKRSLPKCAGCLMLGKTVGRIRAKPVIRRMHAEVLNQQTRRNTHSLLRRTRANGVGLSLGGNDATEVHPTQENKKSRARRFIDDHPVLFSPCSVYSIMDIPGFSYIDKDSSIGI